MYCVAPVKIGANEAPCNQEIVSNSPWCQKHIKQFGGITAKYHELELNLRLDPFDYEKSNEYMKWTEREIEDEFRLLWKIYNLRLKLHQKGFASGLRDIGHEHRLLSINNCLSILNNIMKVDEIECKEYEVEECGDILFVKNDSNIIKLTSKTRSKKIVDQEFIGIWNHDDVITYCKREINLYLLACLRKYFQRWPHGDLMFEYSITMASEMCFTKIIGGYNHNKHACKIAIGKKDSDQYHNSNYNKILKFITDKPFSVIPILSVIKSYNIKMTELLDLESGPVWLIKRFDIGPGALNYYKKQYCTGYNPLYHPDVEKKIVRRYILLKSSKIRIQIPIINIKSIILAIQNKDKLSYTFKYEKGRLIYYSYLQQDIKLFKTNNESLYQFKQDITYVPCDCELVGFAFIYILPLYKEIKHLLSKDIKVDDFLCDKHDFKLLITPGNLHLTFWEISPRDEETNIIKEEKKVLDKEYAKYGNNILY